MSGSPAGTETGPTILVVEDDPTISDLLAYNLRRAGYVVRQEHTGRTGLEAALTEDVALVLMDLMLPGLDGVTAGREIKRHRPQLPLIMLTARSGRTDVLEGFAAGADDYVTKPFDMDVLLARIEARLRSPAPAAADPGQVRFANLVLDRNAHALSSPSGAVSLKRKEHALLELLLSAPGHLFPREEIVERVWHHRYLPGSRTLDVHVRRLREKLAHLGAQAEIETVRGVGYRLVATGGDPS